MSVGRTVVRLRARTGASQPPHDFEAELAPDVTVGAFADAVADRLDLNGSSKLAAALERTGAVLRGDEPLLAAGVRNGDTLAFKPAADAAPLIRTNDPTRFDLVVVGGPAAGRVVSLTPGTYVIGRDASCDVTVEDPSMSRRHLRVRIDGARVTVVDPGSNNGTWVRDTPLRHHEPYTLHNGEVLRLARTLISIRPSRPRVDALSSDGTGNVNFNRPPRVPRPWRPQKVTIPAPPGKPAKAKLPLVASLIPLVLGGVMYLVYPNPIMIAFMAMAPVMALFSFFEERRGGKKHGKEALKRWDETLAKLDADLHALAVEEERERNLGAPDAGELIHRAVSHSADLWERRPTAPDFLHVRIGTARNRLAIGSHGRQVRTLQRLLNKLGFRPKLEVDGIFGPLTQAALKKFQTKQHLEVNGVAGDRTWEALLGHPIKIVKPNGGVWVGEGKLPEGFRGDLVKVIRTQVNTVHHGSYNQSNKYTAWADRGGASHAEAWCADFVSWAYAKADHPVGPGGKGFAAVSQWRDYFQSKGQWHSNPAVGAVVCFDWNDGGQTTDHVGIVSKIENGRVYYISGNTSNPGGGGVGVYEKSVPMGNVLGYGYAK